MAKCSFGCGQESNYKLKNGKECCSKSWCSCPEVKKKNKESNKKSSSRYWKNKKCSENHRRNIRKSKKGKRYFIKTEFKKGHNPWNKGLTKETDERVRLNSEKSNTKEIRELKRQKMLDGQAVFMNHCLKNPSREQLELFMISCKLLPHPILNYPVYRGKRKRNYSIDIADPKVGIALEFDGWRGHFDSEESIERHKRRQKEIEEEGWKFIRYNIFHSF